MVVQSLYLRLEALEFNSYHVQLHQGNTPTHTIANKDKRPNGHSNGAGGHANMGFVGASLHAAAPDENEVEVVNEREVAPRRPVEDEIREVEASSERESAARNAVDDDEDPFAIVIVSKTEPRSSSSSRNSIPMRNFERPGSQLSVEPIEEVSKL